MRRTRQGLILRSLSWVGGMYDKRVEKNKKEEEEEERQYYRSLMAKLKNRGWSGNNKINFPVAFLSIIRK